MPLSVQHNCLLSWRRLGWFLCLGGVFGIVAPHGAFAQQAMDTLGGTTMSMMRQQEGEHNPTQPLISLSLNDSTVEYIIRQIGLSAGKTVVFNSVGRRLQKRIPFAVSKVSIDDALTAALRGTGLRATFSGDSRTIIVAPTPIAPAGKDSVPHGSIVGKIVDTTGGNESKAIANVTVVVRETRSAVQSKSDGAFVINDIPAGDYTLEFRLLGYKAITERVTIRSGERNSIGVILLPSASVLSEVVTTATGQQRRAEIATDIAVLNVDSIMRVSPAATLPDLLATRVPGVFAPLTSGEPGAGRLLRIRGANSINGSNDPILIVDGVQVNARQIDPPRVGSIFGGATGQSNNNFALSPLDQIDPNSIAKIEVLKGPSAVAAYGSHAANGVIVVTTKRGQVGPARWAMSGQWGMEYIPGKYPLNYYAFGRNNLTRTPMQCTIEQRITGCTVDSVVSYQILNDASTTVLGRGNTQRYSVSVSGGAPTLTYSVTGSTARTLGLMKLPQSDVALLRDRGLVMSADIRRPQANESNNGSARVDLQMGEYRVTFSSSLAQQFTRGTPLNAALASAQESPPIVDSFDVSGNLVARGSALLPLIPNFRERRTGNVYRSLNSLGIARTIWNVTADVTGGLDLATTTDAYLLGRGECFLPSIVMCYVDGNAFVQQKSVLVQNLNVRLNTQTFALANLISTRFALGGNYVREKSSKYAAAGRDVPYGVTTIGGAGNIVTEYMKDDRITAGVYTGMTIGLFNQIYIPLELRQDAGSALGSSAAPRFPSLGFSYVVSDAAGFQRLPFAEHIGVLKLRTGYGRAGRQPPVGAAIRTYSVSTKVVDGVSDLVIGLNGVGNAKLVPERGQEVELGFDVEMFANRVRLNATWVRGATKDLLISEVVPHSVGAGNASQYVNLGDVKTQGRELTLEIIPIESHLLVWSSMIGVTSRSNTLVRLGNAFANKRATLNPLNVVDSRHVVGYPLRGMWMRPLVAYADMDGDGRILPREVQYADSAVYLGSPDPRFTANISQSFSLFGRMTVNLAGSYVSGLTKRNTANDRQGYIQSYVYNDPNAPLSEQAYRGYSAMAEVQTTSSLALEEASIGVNVPRYLTQRFLRTRSLTVSLLGRNLGLWTNFRNIDPRVSGSRFHESSAQPTAALPTPRTWGITARIQ